MVDLLIGILKFKNNLLNNFLFINIENYLNMDNHNTENFEKVLDDIQKRLTFFEDKLGTGNSVFNFVNGVNFQSPFVYGPIVLVLVVISFLIARPAFIKHEIEKNGELIKVISIKKLALYSSVITIILSVAYYYFKLRNN